MREESVCYLDTNGNLLGIGKIEINITPQLFTLVARVQSSAGVQLLVTRLRCSYVAHQRSKCHTNVGQVKI